MAIRKQIADHSSRLSSSAWASRGWTYQEQILSRRTLVFLEDRIFWECDQSIWDGGKLNPSNQERPSVNLTKMGTRLTKVETHDFLLYIDMICFYNYRYFTYPQDALIAISEILNTLQPAFPRGFVSGLPGTFLDDALLWQPLHKGERRLDQSHLSDTKPSAQQISSLPS